MDDNNDVNISGRLFYSVNKLDVVWRIYSFAEAMVLIHFVVMALMWLTRDPEIIPGWQSLLSHK